MKIFINTRVVTSTIVHYYPSSVSLSVFLTYWKVNSHGHAARDTVIRTTAMDTAIRTAAKQHACFECCVYKLPYFGFNFMCYLELVPLQRKFCAPETDMIILRLLPCPEGVLFRSMNMGSSSVQHAEVFLKCTDCPSPRLIRKVTSVNSI